MSKSGMNTRNSEFDMTELIAAEEELSRLKNEEGLNVKTSFWKKCIDKIIEITERRQPVAISKKKYCLVALFGGILGIHQFMVGRKIMGVIYLLLAITGISFAMSILDILYALFLKTDESKLITI